MLRFIRFVLKQKKSANSNFNTSHVTVYRSCIILRRFPQIYFNTSHVTVYPCRREARNDLLTYFNTSHVTVYPIADKDGNGESNISIHLMLRFILNFLICLRVLYLISIHLMLRFIGVGAERWQTCTVISIHLMLRFILSRLMLQHPDRYFNTSHVTVYLAGVLEDWSNVVYFNTSHVTVYPTLKKRFIGAHLFQYISCYGLSS